MYRSAIHRLVLIALLSVLAACSPGDSGGITNEGDDADSCLDGGDNDGDGQVDCDDAGCQRWAFCVDDNPDVGTPDEPDSHEVGDIDGSEDDADSGDEPVTQASRAGRDDDGDGWFHGWGDCDDTDPEVNPGVEETPSNGVDDDCDGTIDNLHEGGGRCNPQLISNLTPGEDYGAASSFALPVEGEEHCPTPRSDRWWVCVEFHEPGDCSGCQGARADHLGEDWNYGSGNDDVGLPVVAIADGVVVATHRSPGWVYTLLVRHDAPAGHQFRWESQGEPRKATTVWSHYAHIDPTRSWNPGDPVAAATQLGTVSAQLCTNCNWPHLHWEIISDCSAPYPGWGYRPTHDGRTDPSDFVASVEVELLGCGEADGESCGDGGVCVSGECRTSLGDEDFEQMMRLAATAHGVPWCLIAAIADEESGWRQDIPPSFDGGVGIMQITGSNIEDLASQLGVSSDSLSDPTPFGAFWNIQAGALHLARSARPPWVLQTEIRDVVETWWYPVVLYNGAGRDGDASTSNYPYRVYNRFLSPPREGIPALQIDLTVFPPDQGSRPANQDEIDGFECRRNDWDLIPRTPSDECRIRSYGSFDTSEFRPLHRCDGTRIDDEAVPCPNDCSGNGTCDTNIGVCDCEDRFAGAACDRCADGLVNFPECTAPDSCPEGCSGHGQCDEERDVCVCNRGFAGRLCDRCEEGFEGYPDCFAPQACPNECSEHGECDRRNGECDCDTGYAGLACDRCDDGFVGYPACVLSQPCPDNCSGHGRCDMETGVCECDRGFDGAACNRCEPGFREYPTCYEALECPRNCSGHGECNDRTGECSCHQGFDGNACDRCANGFADYPECYEVRGCPRDCSGHGECNERTGECSCDRGFDGDACDRCANGFAEFPECYEVLSCPGDCNGHGQCQGRTGVCSCNRGYDGASCNRCANGYEGYPDCREVCGGENEICCPGNECSDGYFCEDSRCHGIPGGFRVQRYRHNCSNAHWSSHWNAECFPGSNPLAGCDQCGTFRNPNCGESTCWDKEQSYFYSFTREPTFGSFRRLYHCFSGGVNLYQGTPCAEQGEPHDLGWVARSPVYDFTHALYICSWRQPRGPVEHFLSVDSGECEAAGGTVVGGGPWGYVLR